MIPNHASVSLAANATTLPNTTRPSRPTPQTCSPIGTNGSGDSVHVLLTRMSQDLQKVISLLEKQKIQGNEMLHSPPGLDKINAKEGTVLVDLPILPYFDYESQSSSDWPEMSSSQSGFGNGTRRYDKKELIMMKICLPYQHGYCFYIDQGIHHEIAFGQEVLHYFGLYWTVSPDIQCYFSAKDCPLDNQCPVPFHNS